MRTCYVPLEEFELSCWDRRVEPSRPFAIKMMVVLVSFVMMTGWPDLSPSDTNLVEGDVVLWFRGLSLFILAEDIREFIGEPNQLVVEQPEDPARYRKAEDVERHQYFFVSRTKEWQQFRVREQFGINMLHFDQHPVASMGHKKRKPRLWPQTFPSFANSTDFVVSRMMSPELLKLFGQ